VTYLLTLPRIWQMHKNTQGLFQSWLCTAVRASSQTVSPTNAAW
jgi:hypothetical protein